MAKIVTIHDNYTTEIPYWVREAGQNTPDWFYDDVENITSLNGLLTVSELAELVGRQLTAVRNTHQNSRAVDTVTCYGVELGVAAKLIPLQAPNTKVMAWAKEIPDGSRRIVTLARDNSRVIVLYYFRNGLKLSVIELSFIQRSRGVSCSSWKRSVHIGEYNQVLYAGSNGDFGYSFIYDPCRNPVFTYSTKDNYSSPQESYVMRTFDSHGLWQEKTFTQSDWKFTAIGNCEPVRLDYTQT
jgi:hypothetical protein